MTKWALAQAKAQFSEVVHRAMTEGPQEVTRGGRDAVVIVSKNAWDQHSRSQREAKADKPFVSILDALTPANKVRFDDDDFPRLDDRGRGLKRAARFFGEAK